MLVSIAEGLDVILIDDNEALVQFGTRSRPSELIRDSDLKCILGKIIRPLLNDSKKLGALLSGLHEEERAEARKLIADLIESGILTDSTYSPIQQYLNYTFSGDSELAGPVLRARRDPRRAGAVYRAVLIVPASYPSWRFRRDPTQIGMATVAGRRRHSSVHTRAHIHGVAPRRCH